MKFNNIKNNQLQLIIGGYNKIKYGKPIKNVAQYFGLGLNITRV